MKKGLADQFDLAHDALGAAQKDSSACSPRIPEVRGGFIDNGASGGARDGFGRRVHGQSRSARLPRPRR